MITSEPQSVRGVPATAAGLRRGTRTAAPGALSGAAPALERIAQRANAGPHARYLAGSGSLMARRSGVLQPMYKRPGFPTDAKKSAILWHNTRPDRPFDVDEKTPDLPSHNAAMPHRFSWKDIRESTKRFHNGKEDAADFKRWTDRFIAAGEERIAAIRDRMSRSDDTEELEELLRRARDSQAAFVSARDAYLLTEHADEGKEFLRQANGFHANVPDLGPHRGVNNPVREAGHLNFPPSRGRSRRRSPSPMSRRVLDMSPERLSVGLAYQDDESLITTSGETVTLGEMSPSVRKRMKRFPQKIVRSFDPDAHFGSTSTSGGIRKKKIRKDRGGTTNRRGGRKRKRRR